LPSNLPAGRQANPVVTWPGFQVLLDGGSRLFVQTSGPVTPELQREGSNWVVLIPGAALPRGNVRLPLDTQFFNTPVRSARLKPRPGGVVLVLEMRAEVAPTLRAETAANGSFFTYVEFPAGSYLPGP
jgi:hypothetical protein